MPSGQRPLRGPRSSRFDVVGDSQQQSGPPGGATAWSTSLTARRSRHRRRAGCSASARTAGRGTAVRAAGRRARAGTARLPGRVRPQRDAARMRSRRAPTVTRTSLTGSGAGGAGQLRLEVLDGGDRRGVDAVEQGEVERGVVAQTGRARRGAPGGERPCAQTCSTPTPRSARTAAVSSAPQHQARIELLVVEEHDEGLRQTVREGSSTP